MPLLLNDGCMETRATRWRGDTAALQLAATEGQVRWPLLLNDGCMEASATWRRFKNDADGTQIKVIGTEPDQFLCIYLAQKSNPEPTVPAHVTFGMVVVRPRRAALHNLLAPARCGATRPFLGRIGPDCPDYVSELGAGARNPSRLAVSPYCTDLLRNVYFAVRFHDLHKFMYVPACRRPYRRHLRSEPSRNLSQAVREHSKIFDVLAPNLYVTLRSGGFAPNKRRHPCTLLLPQTGFEPTLTYNSPSI